MPKMQQFTCEMVCTLSLTEKETKMLAYLASFGGHNIAESIRVHLGTEFSHAEWKELWDTMRTVLEQAQTRMNETRMVFSGVRYAAKFQDKSDAE